MSDPDIPNSEVTPEPEESFRDLLSQYEQSHSRRDGEGGQQLRGTVIAIYGDSVILDIGYKSEGILPLGSLQSGGEAVRPGETLLVTVKGRNPEGYYELSLFQAERPKDWASL